LAACARRQSKFIDNSEKKKYNVIRLPAGAGIARRGRSSNRNWLARI